MYIYKIITDLCTFIITTYSLMEQIKYAYKYNVKYRINE